MAISNATRLSDFGSGIGTAGAVLKVDNTNDSVGIGTTDPRGMLQVGLAITMNGNTGIATFHTVYGARIFQTDESITISAGTSYYVSSNDASGNVAFTRLGRIHVASGATFQVGSGTTFIMDVLNVFV